MQEHSSPNLRVATVDDAAQIRKIYAPYVEATSISFELVVPTVQQIAGRIQDVTNKYPWLVYERDARILGYAYANEFRSREAYRFTSETAVYVDSECSRQGIGRCLMLQLIQRLKDSGHQQIIAGVTLPNKGSVGLHESLGFRPVGVCSKVGFKFDQWHDVGFWQLDLST